jgi:hypothetical protein
VVPGLLIYFLLHDRIRSCSVLGDCLICLLGTVSPDCLLNITSFTDIQRVPLYNLSISLSSCLLHSDIISYKGLTITGDMYVTDHMWWHCVFLLLRHRTTIQEAWTEFSPWTHLTHTMIFQKWFIFTSCLICYMVYSFLVFPWITAFCFWAPHSGTSVTDSSALVHKPCETCLLNSQPWYSLQLLAVTDICIDKCHIEHTPPVPPPFRMAV